MKKFYFLFVCLSILVCSSFGQINRAKKTTINKPKLVIGMVVDQMRWDFLYRYADRYTTGGFKRLMNEGYQCNNTFINYLPSYTAPGHTCIYTGSVPAIHGIVGNNWYSTQQHKMLYCTEDSTANSVGSLSDAGKMSPNNLWTTTITDELRLASNFRSKVIGIALKDRGAILPAGHAANAAYWYDNTNGAFISSTYYMKQLPDWLTQFNEKKLPDEYLKKNWYTLYPIATYKNSSADTKPYENKLPQGKNTFPHITDDIVKDKYGALRSSPYGNTLTIEMAKAAIEGEKLGQSDETDFLTISFSSTDYIGHAMGPNSIEAEDTYLRLDKELQDFFTYLDQTVGVGQYTLFLTADHGAAHVPGFLTENNILAGNHEDSALLKELNAAVAKDLHINNAIEKIMNSQVYISDGVDKGSLTAVKNNIINTLIHYPEIAMAVDLANVSNASIPEPIKKMIVNGYNQKLSGDIQYLYKPQWIDGASKGTTHGSWNPYDTHIPLLWYGWGINKGKTNKETYMTDIAATLAALLKIQMPSGCIGHVIEEAMK